MAALEAVEMVAETLTIAADAARRATLPGAGRNVTTATEVPYDELPPSSPSSIDGADTVTQHTTTISEGQSEATSTADKQPNDKCTLTFFTFGNRPIINTCKLQPRRN